MKRTATFLALFLLLMAAPAALVACGSAEPATTDSVKISSAGSTTTSAGSTTTADTATSAGSTTTADDSETTLDAADAYEATDTSYKSATKSITISTVTKGSGNDKITYYVADVRLADSLDLESAFANGAFNGKAQDTSTIAEANDAIIAINGDYYTSRSNGITIRNGVVYRDKPARQGLAIYKDGSMKVYDEKSTTAEKLLAKGVWNTISFGPGLLVDGEVPKGIEKYAADPDGKHNIQGHNPRTGIGMVKPNRYVFVVVDGRNPGYSHGVTIPEFAQIFKNLGCTTAYNLDGGGSSTLYFMGKLINDPAAKSGQRSVSDILFID